jgi:hypothetical protein
MTRKQDYLEGHSWPITLLWMDSQSPHETWMESEEKVIKNDQIDPKTIEVSLLCAPT